jgi:DNA topoisomerase-3
LEVPEAETLITERTIGPLQGFRSRLGRPFAAILKLTDEHKLEFDFGQNDDENSEPVDFSAQESLGSCPKCQSSVYEHKMNYTCEKAVGPTKTCDFRTGKVILQQEIEPSQIQKLLSEGRTDLLTGFVSSRTRRKFKAYLKRGEDGKVGFEFEPRKPKGDGDLNTNGNKVPPKRPANKKLTAKKSPSKKSARKVKTLKSR